MIGVNGFQYIEDSIDCMICTEECTSSTCDSGPRILPWTQDLDDGVNCQGENEGLCEGNDEDGDIWDSWNILLRDFIILDRNGIEFARINLTYNNPDPTELGECSGNYQKIVDILVDCDNDTLIYKVNQKGPACHKGMPNCFFNKLDTKES